MLDEPEKNSEGRFQKNPLLILIWAVMPIVVVFGFSMTAVTQENLGQLDGASIISMSIAQIVSVGIMLVLPALLISYVYKKDIWTFLGLRKLPKLTEILIAAGIVLSANTFLNYLLDLNAVIPLPDNMADKFQLLQETTSQSQAFFLDFNGPVEFGLVFLTMAIVPALAEEMYFRGLVEGVLIDMKIGAVHAIIISSFLFALMHFQFYYLFVLLFMGTLLGYFYYRTKNLWLSIFMHLMNNGLIVLVSGSNSIGMSNIDLEATPPVYTSIIGALLFCGLVYLFHQKTSKVNSN